MFKVTRKTKARFVYSPFSTDEMVTLAETVMAGVIKRIKSGINCDDLPAKPLKQGKNGKPGYPDYKARKGVAPIRNWVSQIQWPRNRIKTLRALKVKTANENRAVIGFIDPRADQIAHINNRIDKQFGLSPSDKILAQTTAYDLLRAARLVKVKKAA